MLRNLIIGIGMMSVATAMGGFKSMESSPDRPVAIPDKAPGAKETDPRKIKQNVVAYHTSDKEMNAAKDNARQTLPRFFDLIRAQTQGTYTVKFPLTQNGATEHIWMQLTGHKGGRFQGLLANAPVNGNRYRKGDRIEVAEAEIEDWMVNTGSEMYGGYTVRVMLKDMPKEQAAVVRKMLRD